MSITYESIRNRVLVHAPDAGEPMIDTFIRDVLSDFTLVVRGWDFDSGDVTYPADAVSITLAVPEGSRVGELRTVRVSGVPRSPGTADDRRSFELGQLDGAAPVPFYLETNKLALLPAPAADTTVRVFASLEYDSESDTIPAILSRHEPAIADGVLAKVLDVANRPWSDSNKAARFRDAYEGARSEASVWQSAGQSSTPVRRRPRFG